MKIKRILAGLLTVVCLCCILSVQAETVRGDLTARFAGKPTMELDGETLTLRGRVTTVLLVGMLPREQGREAYLIALVAEDDNRKLVSPVWLEGGVAAAAFQKGPQDDIVPNYLRLSQAERERLERGEKI